jgi:serine phosphatase RsbU (regulator of sigma subunit)
MPRKSPNLKLHTERQPTQARPRLEQSRAVQQLCESFGEATGWKLAYHSNPAELDEAVWSALIGKANGTALGRLSVTPPSSEEEALLDLPQVKTLAAALANVLDELELAKRTVWEREAELAAGVPITSRPDEKQHFAERLEGVLQGGVNAVQCQAAALYLLDDATTELKLRSTCGLPKDRLLAPARPLKGAIADLEALVGHAVVLEDTALLPHWRVPEEFPSAVCVPVSTATVPLGTLWFFCDRVRDFTEQETNLIEIVAGRLAADLEREMLLQEGVQSKEVKKQWTGAVTWQQARMPKISPIVEGWQVAGWTEQVGGIGGDFHDWSVHQDGRLSLALGDAQGSMLTAGFTASAVQAALRSHAAYPHNAKEMLARINDTLWSSSSGDEFASLFYGLIDPDTGGLECSLAGTAALLLIRQGQHEFLTTDGLQLGMNPDTLFTELRRTLLPGDVLVAMTEGVREARDRGGLRIGESAIATLVRRAANISANELAERMRQFLQQNCPGKQGLDRSVLVAKRKRDLYRG